MNLEQYLRFESIGTGTILSGLFLIGLLLKVLSTFIGLMHKAKSFLPTRLETLNWWASKISALGLCTGSFGLCYLAGDLLGQIVFGGLGIIALALVSVMASRRASGACYCRVDDS